MFKVGVSVFDCDSPMSQRASSDMQKTEGILKKESGGSKRDPEVAGC